MRRKGFTLIEMVTVVGVLMLLTSMALPVLARARRSAVRLRMQADLAVLRQGLEAYRLDHRDYPRLSGNPAYQMDGAELLCLALIAPGPATVDGADGPGFRIRGTRGQVYGPYVNPDKFKTVPTDGYNYAIVDRNDPPQKIHYCPANQKADISAPRGFVDDYSGTGPRPMYDHGYLAYCLSLENMRKALGDIDANGQIDPGETPVYTGHYLLWSAGPNGVFGPDPDDPMQKRSDDVTNFTP